MIRSPASPRPWSAPNPQWPERAMPILSEDGSCPALAYANDFERRKADAALIVAAVNNIERARDALKALVEAADDTDVGIDAIEGALEQAREVLDELKKVLP